MKLNKLQKVLLFLILISLIAFTFELKESNAVSSGVSSNQDKEVFNSSQSLKNASCKSNKTIENRTTNKTKIDYGQPIVVPEDFFKEENKSNFSEIADSLPKNNSKNNATENISIKVQGPINSFKHDLGIEKIYTRTDSENPLRLIIKVKVKNYGDFKESKLYLRGKVNERTRFYGPYNKTITRSRTITSQWTQKEPGTYNITFEILNYSNFSLDANEENNIKSIIVYLSGNGTIN